MSQWGPSFRPEYAALTGLREHFPNVPIAGFTATADKVTREDIRTKLLAPGAALFLAVFAENKITGLAFTKVLNAIGLIPVLAYFIQSDWQLLAGVLPAYWPMKVVWLAAAGESYAWYAVVGLGVNLAVLYLLLRRFSTILHR